MNAKSGQWTPPPNGPVKMPPSWARPGRELTNEEQKHLNDFEKWWVSTEAQIMNYNQKYLCRAVWMAARGCRLNTN